MAGQAPQFPGILMLLAASFCWAAGTLLVRRRPVALDPFAATAWEMVLGGAFNLIIGILLQGREPVVWNVRLLGALAYLAGFGSISDLRLRQSDRRRVPRLVAVARIG